MNKEKITDEVLELVDSIIGANALIAIGMSYDAIFVNIVQKSKYYYIN